MMRKTMLQYECCKSMLTAKNFVKFCKIIIKLKQKKHQNIFIGKINLIKIRSFDPLPQIATKGSNEIPVQSREYLANQKTAYASA